MKSSTKFVLLALAAAGLTAVVTLPASAQQFKPRGDQTCDNPSTARDKVLKPGDRCFRVAPDSYKEQQRITSFVKANPPDTTTTTNRPDGTTKYVFEGSRNGVPYRIEIDPVTGRKMSGSASHLSGSTARNGGSKARSSR
jgi:hypothetical protein